MTLRALWCLLTSGHYYELKVDDGRMWLRCTRCEHESTGVSTAQERQRRQREPDPVPDDWFEREHFQGEHRR